VSSCLDADITVFSKLGNLLRHMKIQCVVCHYHQSHFLISLLGFQRVPFVWSVLASPANGSGGNGFYGLGVGVGFVWMG
jgi:hypothetical protein